VSDIQNSQIVQLVQVMVLHRTCRNNGHMTEPGKLRSDHRCATAGEDIRSSAEGRGDETQRYEASSYDSGGPGR